VTDQPWQAGRNEHIGFRRRSIVSAEGLHDTNWAQQHRATPSPAVVAREHRIIERGARRVSADPHGPIKPAGSLHWAPLSAAHPARRHRNNCDPPKPPHLCEVPSLRLPTVMQIGKRMLPCNAHHRQGMTQDDFTSMGTAASKSCTFRVMAGPRKRCDWCRSQAETPRNKAALRCQSAVSPPCCRRQLAHARDAYESNSTRGASHNKRGRAWRKGPGGALVRTTTPPAPMAYGKGRQRRRR